MKFGWHVKECDFFGFNNVRQDLEAEVKIPGKKGDPHTGIQVLSGWHRAQSWTERGKIMRASELAAGVWVVASSN